MTASSIPRSGSARCSSERGALPLSLPVRAFLVACLGIALFACMDAAMKGLSQTIGAHSAMIWRTAAGIVIAGLPYAATRPALPDRRMLTLHLARGAVTAAMTVCFFWGLARTPMALAIALTFIAPLIALYLAAATLGERVGRGALVGSFAGLAGVGVVLAGQMGAGPGKANWAGIGAILFSALCYAVNLVLQRRQAMAARPLEIAFWQSLTMCGFLLLAAPFTGVASPAGHWPAILLAAALATVSLLLLSWAYGRAEASYLVSVEYSAFLWAALLGWLAFGETLRPATLAGAALIVAGCLYAARAKRYQVVEGAL